MGNDESTIREVLRGWDLVRGPAENWGNPPELLAANEQVRSMLQLGDAAYGFLHKRNSLASEVETLNLWQVTLRVLEARQLGLLESIQACVMIGRPFAAYALLRSMYESFLNVLLICCDSGQIRRDLVSKSEFKQSFTKEELAERFDLHAASSMLQDLLDQSSIPAWSPGIQDLDIEATIKMLETKITMGEKLGLRKDSRKWHPFTGIRAIREHLWPQGGIAKEPLCFSPIDESFWHVLYRIAYLDPNEHVHGNKSSFYGHELHVSAEGLTYWQRAWDALPITTGISMVLGTYNSTAWAEGHEELWSECLDSSGFLDGDMS